jgi:NAD(P)H dehydrogenase (quinone)
MARIAIIYQSKTGNIERMSEAVEAGVKGEGVSVIRKRVENMTLEDLLAPQGIIIGTPTYFGATTAGIKNLIDQTIKIFPKLEGKVGAAFPSSGDLGGGGETAPGLLPKKYIPDATKFSI